ncbi:MAG TPA: hypothetical protein VGN88_02995 [Phycisphaerae bacterium]
MTTRITTCARSPLGRFLALAFISLILLFVGLQLLSDTAAGGVNASIQALLKSVSTPTMQARQREALQAISDRIKNYDKVELLILYGSGIFAAFALHGWAGWMIRAYRFRFLSAQGVVERQALWLFIPVWFLGWVVMALVILLITGTSATIPLLHLAVPLWILLAMIIPAAVIAAGWKFLPRITRRILYIPGMRRRQSFQHIKRIDLQTAGDGGTSLVVTFKGESSWTVSRGSVKRLQRVGNALSRVTGLQRQDLATWS